jgi:hypothetical protein
MNAITVYALRFAGGEIYVGITKDLCRVVMAHLQLGVFPGIGLCHCPVHKERSFRPR